MTVKELKDVLELMDDDARVVICANTPAGWVCPDGAVVDVDSVYMGFDWHQGKVLVVPKHSLDIHDVEEWAKPHKEDTSDKQEEKKEVFCNGMSVGEYIKMIDDAHEASKSSKLRFQ